MNEWISLHLPETLVIVALAGSTLIEISPIKINPWTKLASRIGKAINKDMMDNVTNLKNTLDQHIRASEERYAKHEDSSFQ